MANKKVLNYDPIQKKTTYFHGGDDGQHHVSVEQKTDNILKLAKDKSIDYKPNSLIGKTARCRATF